MNTTKLTFDPSGWLEINYIETIQLPDVVTPEVPAVLDEDGNEVTPAMPEHTVPGGTQSVVLQSTSYHPTQLELIHADCATHGVTIEGDDAQAVAEWVADYVPPPPAPVQVPQEVSALQGLLAIDAAGLAEVYEAWAHSPDRTFAQKAFINKAQTWKRSDPTLSAAAADIGLTEANLDALFTAASSL